MEYGTADENLSLKKYQGQGCSGDSGYGSSFCSSSTVSTTELQATPNTTITESIEEHEIKVVEECFEKLDLKETPRIDSVSQENQKQLIVQYLKKALTPDEDNDTYLTILLAKGHFKQVAQLIDICPKSAYLDIQNKLGQAAIHVAAYLNIAPIVYMLIRKSARIDLVDIGGKNIFHICAERGHVESFEAIMEAVKQTNQWQAVKPLLNERDFSGFTPFFLAVSNGNRKMCEVMAAIPVDVNSSDIKNGNTPLHEAVIPQVTEPSFIHFLLDHCKLNVNHQNNMGIAPLHIAVAKGDKAVCAVLLLFGANVNLLDINNHRPADYTCDESIIRYLQS